MSPVERVRPLPEARGRGKLLVAESVLAETSTALQSSFGEDGRHEGLVLWLGRVIDATTLVVSLYVPDADHGPGHVRISERQVSATSRSARRVDSASLPKYTAIPELMSDTPTEMTTSY